MPARGRRGGGFPLWLGIIILVILGVVLWLFLKGDAFDDDGATAGGPGTTADGSANPGEGTITLGSDDLLQAAGEGNDALVEREGEAVAADGATVQGVLSEEAFWVGGSSEERVLVVLEPEAGSAPAVEAGDRVSFRGTLEALPVDFVERYGVSASEDADLLLDQGHYVRTDQVEAA